MDPRPRISLYVPAYNAERYLARCLEAIQAQTLRPDEVLVVDDGSTDRTAEIARGYPVTVVPHGVNQGLAAARNTGVRSARNELVASLDADCRPEPEWLERLAARFVGERTALGGGRLEEAVQRTAGDRFRKLHMPQHWGSEPRTNPPHVHGNNNLGRKSALLEVGGYDERLRTNFEDVDLSRRLRARGYDTYYEPSALVWHLKEDDGSSILRALWRYTRLGYEEPITRANVLRRVGRNVRVAFRLLTVDAHLGDWEVLRLDALIPIYFAAWDGRLLREARSQDRGPR